MFATFPFDAEQSGVTQVRIKDSSEDEPTFLGIADSMPQASGASEAPVPGRLRVSDIDMDGYPDIAMTLKFKNSTDTFSKTTFLLN